MDARVTFRDAVVITINRTWQKPDWNFYFNCAFAMTSRPWFLANLRHWEHNRQWMSRLFLAHNSVLLQLNLTPGRKGLAEMVGKVPSWVQFKEKERVEVSTVAP